jgi:glycerophosphoryl diester phosphodiesterase
MRRPIAWHAALVVTILTAMILPPGQSLAQTAAVDVHAHRGGAGLAPENTLAAFRNALAMGVDVLEMDLHVTADGEVVVIHDPTLERTTTGRGYVRATALADLQRFDAGAWFNPQFAGELVPTMRAVFDLVRASGNNRVRFNIETKYEPSVPAPPQDFEERVLRVIREAGMTNRVIIQSFYYPSLARTKTLDRSVATAALRAATDPTPDPVAVVRAVPADIYSPSVRLVSRATVDAVHRAGIPIVPWTVDDSTQMERLLEMGIGTLRGDGIITNSPDRLIQVLRAKGLRR